MLFTFFVFSQKKILTSFEDKNCLSFINITGNTNVNNFEFTMDFSEIKDGFIINNEIVNVGNRITGSYEISVPVKSFETSNKLIYKDFLELVKAEKYPKIIISIPYSQLQKFIKGYSDSITQIQITIAGVTKSYSIPGYLSSCSSSGSIFVNGMKNINLSDFNLDPPEKFQGLIKVKDQVKISFGFVFLMQNNV